MIKNNYICSAGHQDSTLLDMLIDSHSKNESLGENTQLPKNLAMNTVCGYVALVRECGFWKSILRDLERNANINTLSNPCTFNLEYIAAKVIVDKKHQTRFYNFSRIILHALLYLYYRYSRLLHFVVVKKLQAFHMNNIKLYQSVRRDNSADVFVGSPKSYLKGHGIYLYDKEKSVIMRTGVSGASWYEPDRCSTIDCTKGGRDV